MRLEFSEQIFEKYSDIKFNDNLSNGNCVFFLCRQTDRTINKIFMSYTTINIKIHTIKCYKFLMATCFGHPQTSEPGHSWDIRNVAINNERLLTSSIVAYVH